ncbi:MAG TPA: DUF1015 domain-containing protein [Candidatus Omnitrophota bacterium]|nr:DUF1015 domain-containing protein [Candidatus Omnitrophota bacterium]
MAGIKPFKAVYYNLDKIADLSKVVSPPYDVISAEERDFLHDLSPYNFTHIDLGRDMPNDDATHNKYTRANETFLNWLKEGIMIQDESPCIYFYKQDYKIMGQKYSRIGFISLMELEDEKGSRVYPHENTHAKAVDDRFKLCESLESDLSSIFVCYSDKYRKIEKIFTKHVATTEPVIDIEDNDHVHHQLWRLEHSGLIAEISATLADQHLFIADGHHRYKVALDYRAKQLSRMAGGSSGAEPFNYVMTYFTNMDSEDLKIFPMHRIVKKFSCSSGALGEFFRIDTIKKKDDLLVVLAQAGRNEHAFGLYTREGTKLLRLKNRLLIDEYVKEGSKEYKNLDAAILKSFLFDRMGVKSEDIIFTKDLDQVMGMVDANEAEAGFVMNPVKISQLKAVALNGERMPPKTTYFYPKVLSGLTVYKMD